MPIGVSLWSALSDLSKSRYSDLEVNILYGSLVPFVTKSSIRTYVALRPIYYKFFFEVVFNAAFIPATIPCAAAPRSRWYRLFDLQNKGF